MSVGVCHSERTEQVATSPIIATSNGPFDMVTLHFIRDLLDTVDRLQSTKYFIRISDSAVPHVLIFLLNLGTIEGKVLFRKL